MFQEVGGLHTSTSNAHHSLGVTIGSQTVASHLDNKAASLPVVLPGWGVGGGVFRMILMAWHLQGAPDI